MYGQSGHSFHAEWQDNNHGDPGAIADPWSFTAGTSTKPDYATAVVVQTYLHLMGYDLGSWGIDGSFGAVSLAALQQYRTDFGLPGTGYPTVDEIANMKDENVAKIDTIIANQEAIKTELTVLKSGMTALSALGTLSTLPEDIENLKQYIDTKLVTVAKSDQVVYLHEATTNQFLSLSADLEVIETKIEELQKLQAQLKTVTNDLGGMVANMTTVLGDDHDQLKAAIEEPRTISLELT